MINFREIFNPSYSYIGLILIAIIALLIIFLEKRNSIRIIGYSCLASGLVLLIINFIGNLIVSNNSYKFFIEIITNSFFGSLDVLSILNIAIGTITIYFHRYLEQQ